MELDLTPFLCESLSTNSKIYKDLDLIYKEDKFTYYKLAKNSFWYSHAIAKEGSLMQEEYFKKALGIVLKIFTTQNENYDLVDSFAKMLKKGWKYAYSFAITHNKIDTFECLNRFILKSKDISNVSDDELNSNFIILFILSQILNKEIIEDADYNKAINDLHLRLKHYNDNTRISKDVISKDNLKIIRIIKNKLKAFGITNNINTEVNKKDNDLFIFAVCLDLALDCENFSYKSVCNDLKFSDKELEEIIYVCLLYFENINKKITEENLSEHIKDISIFVITQIRNRYMIKAYKYSKEYYFKNNKETLFIDLEEKELELKEEKKKFLLMQNDNEFLKNELDSANLEIKRLKEELEKANENKKETDKLREFIFNQDNIKDFDENNIDFKKLEQLKCIIIGGHPNWQNKIKNYLKNATFINVDMLNFDTNILKTTDLVLIYTNYLNHAMYYKIINEIRNNDIILEYLAANTNEKIILKQIQNILLKNK